MAITMPQAVVEWFAQFQSQTVEVHVNKDGFLTLWTKRPIYADSYEEGKLAMKSSVIKLMHKLSEEQYTIHGYVQEAYECMSPNDCIKYIEDL